MPLYEMVELEDGVEVQFVGVHVLRWQKEWGEPQVGFVEYDPEDQTLEKETKP